MNKLKMSLMALPVGLMVACGGSQQATDAANSASYNNASMDVDANETALVSGIVPEGIVAIPADGSHDAATAAGPGSDCHPYLFLRTRAQIHDLNRGLKRVLDHVADALAVANKTAGKVHTWTHVANGYSRTLVFTETSTDVYQWSLSLSSATVPAAVVASGQVDRTKATSSTHEVSGNVTLDFSALKTVVTTEKASGQIVDTYVVNDAGKTVRIQVENYHWDISDPGQGLSTYADKLAGTARNDNFVFSRVKGKGGSIKAQTEMVFLCPSDSSTMSKLPQLATVDLVSRWKVSGTTVVGRSDGMISGGQYPSFGINRVVATSCHTATAESAPQSDASGYWMLKSEDASNHLIAGGNYSYSSSTAATGAAVQPAACDASFNPIPTLSDTNGTNDYNFAGVNFTDASTFPIPL